MESKTPPRLARPSGSSSSGIATQFVDLKQKPMAAGEINRFIARFGLAQLVDLEAESLKYLKLTEAELLARVERDPKLLRLPLVRSGKLLSTGRIR